jgi:hypothetical protein
MTLQADIAALLQAGVRTFDELSELFSDSTETEIQNALTALIEMDPPEVELSNGVYHGK